MSSDYTDDFGPCLESCPMKNAMDILGGKWKIPILCALLHNSPIRYNMLLREIKGITNTMLSSSLKELERGGLVKRIQYQEMPLRVEYSATDICKQLIPAFRIIRNWSIDTVGTVKKGRECAKIVDRC